MRAYCVMESKVLIKKQFVIEKTTATKQYRKLPILFFTISIE
jgi:hypothetical protein